MKHHLACGSLLKVRLLFFFFCWITALKEQNSNDYTEVIQSTRISRFSVLLFLNIKSHIKKNKKLNTKFAIIISIKGKKNCSWSPQLILWTLGMHWHPSFIFRGTIGVPRELFMMDTPDLPGQPYMWPHLCPHERCLTPRLGAKFHFAY